MLKSSVSSVLSLFARDDRRLDRKTTSRRLFAQQLEDRSMLAAHHAYIVSEAISSQTTYEGEELLLAEVALVGDDVTMITDLTFAAEGNFVPTVWGDYLDANGRFGQDGWYETLLDVPVSLDAGRLSIALHPHGMSFSGGIFLKVIGTPMEASQTIGLSDPDLAVVAYENLPYPDASPVNVHVIGAALPTYEVIAETFADLIVVLSAPAVVTEGDTLTYVASAINLGPETAENVTVEFPIPEGLIFDAAGSPAWVLDGNFAVYNCESLLVGQSITQMLSFTVGETSRVEAYVFVYSPASDPNGDNNFSQTVTTIVEQEDLGHLFLAMKAIGTTDTAVKNEANINLLRFEARAGEADDILLTSASFDAVAGSLLNVHNYTLWVDTDGDSTVDTVLQTGTVPVGGVVMFDEHVGSGYVVPAGNTVVFEVHGDVASSLTSSSLQLGIIGVEAEESDDGSSLSGSQITVTSVPSKIWTFVDQGSLFVTQDSTPVRSRQLLGGALSETVLRLQLRAENEPIEVTHIFLPFPGNIRSVDRVELVLEGETTAFAIGTIGAVGAETVPAGYTTYLVRMESGQLIVPEWQEIDVPVRLRMKSDDSGAISGEEVIPSILAVFPSIRARGVYSSNTLLANDGDSVDEGEVFIGTDVATSNHDIIGPTHTTVLEKITDVTNANPDVNGTSVPTGVSPIAQFRFTAAANVNDLNGTNKVALETLTFRVNATNVQVNAEGFRFYNKSDATTNLSTVVTTLDGAVLTGNITGNFLVRVTSLSASAVDAVLDSGESATFVLEGDIRNPVIDGTRTSMLQGTLDLRDEFFSWYDQDAGGRTLHHGTDLADELVRSTLYQS